MRFWRVARFIVLAAIWMVGCGSDSGDSAGAGGSENPDDLRLGGSGRGGGQNGGPDDMANGGGEDGGGGAGNGGGTPSGARQLTFPSAVLVAVAGDEDHVRVLGLEEDGIVDHDVRVEVPSYPDALAVHPRGKEAVVTYGLGPSSDDGVVFFEFESDGSSASAKQMIAFDSMWSPRDVAYLDEDTVVVAMAGPEDDNLLFLKRNADGEFEMGERMMSGPAPLRVAPLPSSRVLMLRSDLQGTSAVEPVARMDSGEWNIVNRGVTFPDDPIDLALHPTGTRAYVPLYDHMADPNDPDRPGILYVLTENTKNQWEVDEEFPLSLGAYTLAVSASGKHLVVANSYHDQVGGFYRLVSVELDSEGRPSDPEADPVRIDAHIIQDMAYGPDDILVVGYMSTEDTEEYVELYKGAPDLEKLGDGLAMDGSIQAIAIWE